MLVGVPLKKKAKKKTNGFDINYLPLHLPQVFLHFFQIFFVAQFPSALCCLHFFFDIEFLHFRLCEVSPINPNNNGSNGFASKVITLSKDVTSWFSFFSLTG